LELRAPRRDRADPEGPPFATVDAIGSRGDPSVRGRSDGTDVTEPGQGVLRQRISV
jgi:hypothetical protein